MKGGQREKKNLIHITWGIGMPRAKEGTGRKEKRTKGEEKKTRCPQLRPKRPGTHQEKRAPSCGRDTPAGTRKTRRARSHKNEKGGGQVIPATKKSSRTHHELCGKRKRRRERFTPVSN